MSSFYSLKIVNIQRKTTDTVSIAFEVPPRLKATYDFHHGQYLNLQTHLSGKVVCRPYSIYSSPNSGELRVAIKHVPGGEFSSFANTQLKCGDYLNVSPPLGRIQLETNLDEKKQYIGVASGSGITALMPIIQSILEDEPASSLSLLYGAKTRQDMLFRAELEQLKELHIGRFDLIFLFSREKVDDEQTPRRLDASTCRKLFAHHIAVAHLHAAFICGPRTMMTVVKKTLAEAGLEARKIHAESFSDIPDSGIAPPTAVIVTI